MQLLPPYANKYQLLLYSNEWSWLIRFYLQYLPLFQDQIVGESNWRNNTHAELIFRDKKQFKKHVLGNELQDIFEYTRDTVSKLKMDQRIFVNRSCSNYTKLQFSTNELVDGWSKGSGTFIRKASDPQHLRIIRYFCSFVNEHKLQGIPQTRLHRTVNEMFARWKRDHQWPVVRSNPKTISEATLKKLQKGYEINFSSTVLNLYEWFFRDNVQES